MQDPSTVIGGVQYATKLLGGRDARVVGLIVSSAFLRGLSVAVAKADLTKLIKDLPGLKSDSGETSTEGLTQKLLDTLAWSEIAATLGGVADGAATVLEMVGPDGLETLSNAFTAQTTVWLPSDAPGAAGVFPVALSNRNDHWVGRWPQYLQWLIWEVRVNGFFPDLGELLARSKPSTGTAGAPESPAST
jgi:hypothetical protein